MTAGCCVAAAAVVGPAWMSVGGSGAAAAVSVGPTICTQQQHAQHQKGKDSSVF
jgi:hypothetical protein